jgi:hypothetical protein
MKKTSSKPGESPSKLIDARIKELGDWRGRTLGRLRALIKEADPDVVEEWKWAVPVWSHDAAKLFNSSLEGNTRRAIDFHEGVAIDEKAFKALIRAAVAVNQSK